MARYEHGRAILDTGIAKANLDSNEFKARAARAELDKTLCSFETIESRLPNGTDIDRVVSEIILGKLKQPESTQADPVPPMLPPNAEPVPPPYSPFPGPKPNRGLPGPPPSDLYKEPHRLDRYNPFGLPRGQSVPAEETPGVIEVDPPNDFFSNEIA